MSVTVDRDTARSAEPDIALGCGWSEALGQAPPREAAQGPIQADFVVVGAGFTGLACSRRLAELFPGASVVLLEADRIGAANSGRNSGFLLDISFYGDASPAIQAARTRLQRGGLEELRAVVSEHRIECDWQPWGNLYGAIADQEDRWLSRLAVKYADAGEPLEEWPAGRMAEITGSNRFLRGLFHPGTVLVQPAALVRGLTASLPGNVRLFENSRVRRVVRLGSRLEVLTGESQIAAEKVFICANGGTPDLGHGKNRLVKVSTFAAMTHVLDGWPGGIGKAEAFGLLPTFLGGATLRKTKDNRLLVRQGAAFTPKGNPTAGEYQRFSDQARETVRLRWPELAEVPFAFIWSGVMALTRNNAQVFGELGQNVFVSAFCNGAGNTSGTMAGKLLAELSAGQSSDLLSDQMGLPPPRWAPPDPVSRIFVNREIAAENRKIKKIYAGLSEP
jgi:glycine/D-amino acid oxidase-like deaminating enzyme